MFVLLRVAGQHGDPMAVFDQPRHQPGSQESGSAEHDYGQEPHGSTNGDQKSVGSPADFEHQDGGALGRFAERLKIRDRRSPDPDDDIIGAKSRLSRRTAVLNRFDEHAVAIGGLHEFGSIQSLVDVGGGRRFHIAALGYQCADPARFAVAQQADFHLVPDVQQADGVAQLAGVFHGNSVERDYDVAGLDTGTFRSRALGYSRHQGARRLAEAEFLGYLRGDVVKLHAENAALDLPVFDELVHAALDHVDGDRETYADVVAGSRQDG